MFKFLLQLEPFKMLMKEKSYVTEVIDGKKKYQCSMCSRIVGAKRHMLQHLHTCHNLCK